MSTPAGWFIHCHPAGAGGRTLPLAAFRPG